MTLGATKMKRRRWIFAALIFLLSGAASIGRNPYLPVIHAADYQTKINNPYFPLTPGAVLKYEEKSGGETNESEVTVARETKEIMGIRCVGVHDIVMQGGAIKEETWEWYAQDKQGNVWQFANATQEHKASGRMSREGSWEAGVDAAQPGIVMPGVAKPGPAYRQQYLAGKAEDMGQVIATNESVAVPAGSFSGCLLTKEWSMLESGTERKWYAKGVGVVRAEGTGGEVLVLISIKHP